MLFRVGKVRVSTAVLESHLASTDLIAAFARYIRGDWGDADTAADLTNDLAIADGSRIIATYTSPAGTKFCISTENGCTTIAFADELYPSPEPVAM